MSNGKTPKTTIITAPDLLVGGIEFLVCALLIALVLSMNFENNVSPTPAPVPPNSEVRSIQVLPGAQISDQTINGVSEHVPPDSEG